MADFVDKQELYDYIQKEKEREQSRTPLSRCERGLPDVCYDILDKIDKINKSYAKQLAYTNSEVYISKDLQPIGDTMIDEKEEQ